MHISIQSMMFIQSMGEIVRSVIDPNIGSTQFGQREQSISADRGDVALVGKMP